jgi:hypothetical protein
LKELAKLIEDAAESSNPEALVEKYIKALPRLDDKPSESALSQFIHEFKTQQQSAEAFLRQNHTIWTTDTGAFWGWPANSSTSARATAMRIYSINDAVDNKDLLDPMQRRVSRTALVEFRNLIHDRMKRRELRMPSRGVQLMAMANHILFMAVSDDGTKKITGSTFTSRIRDGERLVQLPKGALLNCGKLSTIFLLVITQFAH